MSGNHVDNTYRCHFNNVLNFGMQRSQGPIRLLREALQVPFTQIAPLLLRVSPHY